MISEACDGLDSVQHPEFLKFVSSGVVDKILKDGSLQFGRLRYYALLEHRFRDNWIGDKSEGIVFTDTDINMDVVRDDLRQALSPFVHVEQGAQNVRVNARIVRTTDCYMFCFSLGSFETLSKVMSEDRGDIPGYDGCIQFEDGRSIYDAVLEKGMVDGQPVTDVFWVKCDVVNYANKVNVTLTETSEEVAVSLPDIFQKDEIYKEQCEVRLVLIPKSRDHQKRDRIFVSIPCDSIKMWRRDMALKPAKSEASKELPTVVASRLEALESDYVKRQQLLDRGPFKQPKGGFDEKIWEEEQKKYKDDMDAFERELIPHRRQILMDYWSLRQQGYVSDDLDIGFYEQANTQNIFINLRAYLLEYFRLGSHKHFAQFSRSRWSGEPKKPQLT